MFDLEAIQISLIPFKFTMRSNSQRKTHQLAQIRHFQQQKFCNEQIL